MNQKERKNIEQIDMRIIKLKQTPRLGHECVRARNRLYATHLYAR